MSSIVKNIRLPSSDLFIVVAIWGLLSLQLFGQDVEAKPANRGKHDLQGNFRVTIPPDLKDEEVVEFRIRRAPGPNLGSLTVVSKSPWKLTWKPELAKPE